MRFFVAHTRGPNFFLLKKRGFITFYPTVDDYVFLPDTEELKPLLRKQTELCVLFLKAKGAYVTISQAEMDLMIGTTVGKIVEGAEIVAIEGICEGLDGIVLSILGDSISCRFQGYNRIYEQVVSSGEVVLKGEEINIERPDVDTESIFDAY